MVGTIFPDLTHRHFLMTMKKLARYQLPIKPVRKLTFVPSLQLIYSNVNGFSATFNLFMELRNISHKIRAFEALAPDLRFTTLLDNYCQMNQTNESSLLVGTDGDLMSAQIHPQ